MSRDWEGDYDNEWWALDIGRWERNARVVLTSKRGQHHLKELEAALVAMPDKRLVRGTLQETRVVMSDGNGYPLVTEDLSCAMGVYAKFKGLPLESFDPDDEQASDTIEAGAALGMARTMAHLVGYENDDGYYKRETDEERYVRVLSWVRSLIRA